MGPKPKPGVLDIAAYAPGKSGGTQSSRVVKLSANENALGCSPLAREAFMANADSLNLYPDMHATSLRAGVGEVYGLDPARLAFGAGSDEIFAIACQAYLSPGDNAVQPEFGFAAWAIAARAAGGAIKNAPEKNYSVDVDAMLAAVDDRTRIVFIANPANPTGTSIPFAEIRRLHQSLRDDILLIIDGAYSEFAEGGDYAAEFDLASRASNVLVTKTFSKLYGLAALRVGWGFAAPAIIDALERIRPPFNTTRAGQAAALAALKDRAFVEQSVDYVVGARGDLADYFASLGLRVIPSAANFVTVLFDSPQHAQEVESALAARGVFVRGLRNYGIPKGLRVTVGPAADLQRFREEFSDICAQLKA